MRESDGLAKDIGRNVTIGINRLTIAQGTFYAPLILVSLNWAPATFAENDIIGNCPRTLGAYNSDVGSIAWPQEATLLDAKQTSRIMAHQLNQSLNGKHALVNEFEHGNQRELHHRHS
jgi:hypothetical protein